MYFASIVATRGSLETILTTDSIHWNINEIFRLGKRTGRLQSKIRCQNPMFITRAHKIARVLYGAADKRPSTLDKY